MARQRTYVTPQGEEYPLYEAPYRYTIQVYKADCRKAQIGNPEECLIALGAKRDKNVLGAFIGSGKDGYILFRGQRNASSKILRQPHVLHFTIPTKAARVRDYFDTHKRAQTVAIKLDAPTAGRTLAHRSKLNKARAERIKAGTHQVKPRTKPTETRVDRIGVPHRPHAIVKNNVVTMPTRESEDKAA